MWTSSAARLRAQDADELVPLASQLRRAGESWRVALRKWLSKGVLNAEVATFIENFMAVTRARSQHGAGSADEQSDDLLSDTELHLAHERLRDALATTIGGKSRKAAAEDSEGDGEAVGHYQNSQAAMSRADEIWEHSQDCGVASQRNFPAAPNLKAVLKAAADSRKQSSDQAVLPSDTDKAPAVASRPQASAAQVHAWLELARAATNPEQHAFLARVVERAVAELEEVPSNTHVRPEPLRWLLHGRPGVSKTYAIQ